MCAVALVGALGGLAWLCFGSYEPAYVESFRKGYVDAWERKETLPVFAPTSDADKVRVFDYTEGMVDGRAALAKWFGPFLAERTFTCR